MTTLPMVVQKKVPGQPDESTIARMTVIRKTMISTIKLHTTRFVRSPLDEGEGKCEIMTDKLSISRSYPRFTKMFIQLKMTLGICDAKPTYAM
jgi:hypothetical protein